MTRIKQILLTAVALFSISLTCFATPLSATTKVHRQLVSDEILIKTIYVHNCEERGFGWHVGHGKTNYQYYGGIGWLDATWLKYKAPSFPRSMSDATPQQQAWAMAHFVGAQLGGRWPDANGVCTGGY